MSWTRQQVAALVDHTLLKPEATAADVASLCWEAADLGVCAVCVSPSMLGAATDAAASRAERASMIARAPPVPKAERRETNCSIP